MEIGGWLLPATLVVSPFVGSFLGTLVVRLPARRPICIARSVCEDCAVVLHVFELIPVISWCLQSGRCRRCHSHIPIFYPFMEIAAFAIAAWSVFVTPGWICIATVVFGWLLLALAVCDWRARILPDILTLGLVVTGLLTGAALRRVLPWDNVAGALAGYGAFWGLAFIYRHLRGREGLGKGDAKLLAGIGAWVTWTGLPSTVLYASVIGLVIALLSGALGKPVSMSERLPLGSYLAIGGWLVWLYGPLLLH